MLQRCFIYFTWLLFICFCMNSYSADRYYMGEQACRDCHPNAFKQWRLSKHAGAFESLAQPESVQMARYSGIDVNPYESPHCMGCHTTAWRSEEWQRDETFRFEDGIQCEACHGPASDYLDIHTEGDQQKSMAAGLEMPGKDFCMICHSEKPSHQWVLPVKPFIYEEAIQQIAHPDHAGNEYIEKEINEKNGSDSKQVIHPVKLNPELKHERYKTPYGLSISNDGKLLLAACETSDSVIVIDTSTGEVVKEIKVGNQPHDVCLSPDNQIAYVSNRGSDSVSLVDMATYQEISRITVGDEPHGLVTDASGETLYVANAGTYDVSVVDLKAQQESKRLAASRGTWGVERSADGERIYVTNNLSYFVPFREPCVSETTVIDTNRAQVVHRYQIDEANLVQGVAPSPDGEFTLVTMIRTKNLIPMTRVMQGWVITNGIGILWKDGRVDQLLLDEPENYFADPTDLVITPDGQYAFVSAGGINKVAMIDLDKMKSLLLNASDDERKNVFPNHLGMSMGFVIKRIDVGKSPRGMVCSPDGKFVYVADGLDDTISVIDVEQQERVRVFDLGGPKDITIARLGQQIFHNADKTYGQQFSCHSCHPDGHIDGITYDIEPDGLGVNPVDNRTLRGILDTAPFKWTGKNPSLSRQCGPRLAVFFTRIDPFTPEQVVALEQYICTIIRPPNRYRHGKELNDAQRRGKELFERTHDNMGNLLEPIDRCVHCHPAPYYTNRQIFDVGTASELDTHSDFDVPHLNNIYDSAPYLHDGRAETLEEIWTRFNPYDEHGVTNDMTKDQLNDLIEYLKTL